MAVAVCDTATAQRGGGGGAGGGGALGGGQGGGRGAGGGRGIPQPPDDGDRQQPDQTPTFRSTVTLVQIDAIVTGADGRPVSGLTADDFEIIEKGEPREITTFSAIDIPLPAPETAGVPAVESDVRSNVGPPGRRYLIALDEVGPDRALRARQFLRDFIERYLGPNDVAAVALTGRGLADSGQDFTSNKRLILQAIDRFSGGFPEFEAKAIASSDSRQLASSLRRLTEFLATMPGRKVLLYVGEGLGGLDPYAARSYSGGALTPGEYDAHMAIAAATRGNVTIYPVDPRRLTSDTPAAESFDTSGLDARADLAGLAQLTGGFAIVGTNNVLTALDRMVRENSSYYTLGFSSGHDERNGRFVAVDVRVKRPGLQVRARDGYVAPLGREQPPSVIRGEARLPTVAEALSSPVAVSDVGMRTAAASYRGKGKNAMVALTIEFDASKLDLVERNGELIGDVEISYLATDSKGKVHPGRRHASQMTVKKAALEQILGGGVRALSAFEVPPGRYQVRIAAGGIGRAGSVVHDLEVPDFGDGALALSSVALTSSTSAAFLTLRLNEVLKGVLPTPPVALRDFITAETLTLYAEAYDNRRDSTPPTLVAELRDSSGKTVRAAATPNAASVLSGERNGRGFTASIPLAGLAPGAYVLRVDARGGSNGATAHREIPIRVW
jgi:VWFA-related protein